MFKNLGLDRDVRFWVGIKPLKSRRWRYGAQSHQGRSNDAD